VRTHPRSTVQHNNVLCSPSYPPTLPPAHLVQHIQVLKVHGPVEGVGLDAADVVGLHAVQRHHQLAQLPLEPRTHGTELVAGLGAAAAAASRRGGVSLRGEEGCHKGELRCAQQLLVLRHHKVSVLAEEVVSLVGDGTCGVSTVGCSGCTVGVGVMVVRN
jgi:hypothetical protein